jgi:hypothetical protein
MYNLLFSLSDFAKDLSDSLGIWYLIILNAFGVVAIVCKVIEYQAKKRRTMFIMVTIACIAWTFYFALYGNLISTISMIVGIARLLVFMQRDTKKWAKSMFWLYFFLVLQVALMVYSILIGFSWLDIFAIVAGYIGIFAYFVTNAKVYRLISFVYMSLWVVNSCVYFYPVALISDSFSTISGGIAIYRFDIRKKVRENNNSKTETK